MRCTHDGCTKSAESKSPDGNGGLCKAHGGGKRCEVRPVWPSYPMPPTFRGPRKLNHSVSL
jgi:hypothetical protein